MLSWTPPYYDRSNSKSTDRDPRLLPHAALRVGTPALVAGASALRGDCWGLPDAEHFVDECGEGAGQFAKSSALDDPRNPPNAAVPAGTTDSPVGILPAESAAAETFRRLSRCALQRLVNANVRAANDGAPRRTARAQWRGAGNRRLNSAVCGQSSDLCCGRLHAAHSGTASDCFQNG